MNAKELGDQPVFPKLKRHQSDLDLKDWQYDSTPGTTYRLWLIGMAMQGFCANDSNWETDRIVALAIEVTDAQLAALTKETETKP